MQTIINFREKIAGLVRKVQFYLKYFRGLFLFFWKKTLPHLKKFHINAFPSSRLKDFNAVDVALKFSSEFVLFSLAGLAAVWNIYFFHGNQSYTDQSHAAKIIAQSPEINRKLYAKMSVIQTVVLGQNSIVPQAQAEDFVELTPSTIYNQEDPGAGLVYSNDTIVQPNPDSVTQLLAKQIKVYETKEGDTLKKIAADNGISQNTIMWANKLTSTAIKPGWFLVILPTDGILVKATDNDTLPDIAHKYNPEKFNSSSQTRENSANTLLDKIIAYNGLVGAEDIQGGDVLIVPGGVVPAPPAPKPTPTGRSDGKIKPQGVVKPEDVDYGTGHIFPWGYCTWYVASKVHVSWGGNAKAWLTNARAAGATTINHAIPGAIVVTTDSKRFGHVALIESVNESGFTVSEMNYEKFGKVNTRFIPHGSKTIRGFIVP